MRVKHLLERHGLEVVLPGLLAVAAGNLIAYWLGLL